MALIARVGLFPQADACVTQVPASILLTIDSPSATWMELCLWSVLALSVFSRDVFNRKYRKCSLSQVPDTQNRSHSGLNWEGPLPWSEGVMCSVKSPEV